MNNKPHAITGTYSVTCPKCEWQSTGHLTKTSAAKALRDHLDQHPDHAPR